MVWHAFHPLKEVAICKSLEEARKIALDVCENYRIDAMTQMSVTVMVSEFEAEEQRDSAQSLPSSWFPPLSAITAQYMAWNSRNGSVIDDRLPMRMHFTQRFVFSGVVLLSPKIDHLFTIETRPFDDFGLYAGLSHRGMAVENANYRVLRGDACSPMCLGEVTGEIECFVGNTAVCKGEFGRDLQDRALSQMCAKHLILSCRPVRGDIGFQMSGAPEWRRAAPLG